MREITIVTKRYLLHCVYMGNRFIRVPTGMANTVSVANVYYVTDYSNYDPLLVDSINTVIQFLRTTLPQDVEYSPALQPEIPVDVWRAVLYLFVVRDAASAVAWE